MKKRMFSMLMAVVMVLSLLPTVALASTTAKPATPTITITCRASDGKLTVKWNAVSGAAKYEVYRATKKAGTFTKMKTTTSTQYINTSAQVGHTYYYKVRAVSSDGKVGSFSTVKHRICDCARPVVHITCSSTNKPKLTWDAISGASKYAIYRSTDGGKTYKYYSSTTKTSFTNTSAKLNTTYRYKVKAISSATKYANSAMSAVRKIKCLPNPALTSVSNTTSGVLVKWGAVSGAAKYRVYYKTGSGSWTKAGDTTNTSLTVKDLTSGKKYSFTVRCLNADGVFVSYYDTTGKSITTQPAHKHSYSETNATKKNCTTYVVTYTCSCGKSYTETETGDYHEYKRNGSVVECYCGKTFSTTKEWGVHDDKMALAGIDGHGGYRTQPVWVCSDCGYKEIG